VPTALYCCVVPKAAVALAGVTAIDSKAAGLTVSTAEPEMLPEVAEIVDVPVAALVAIPAVLIVATLAAEEFQVTVLVRSRVLPSL